MFFNNTNIFLHILLTIPVTLASAERNFSKLKIILNYLRHTICQKKLSKQTTITIEIEILDLDLNNIEEFCIFS